MCEEKISDFRSFSVEYVVSDMRICISEERVSWVVTLGREIVTVRSEGEEEFFFSCSSYLSDIFCPYTISSAIDLEGIDPEWENMMNM